MQHRQVTDPYHLRSGFEGTLTAQQHQALASLISDIQKTSFWPDFEQNPDGSRFLLRFLRATMKDKSGERVFQVDKAKERLIRTLEWRRKYKVSLSSASRQSSSSY